MSSGKNCVHFLDNPVSHFIETHAVITSICCNLLAFREPNSRCALAFGLVFTLMLTAASRGQELEAGDIAFRVADVPETWEGASVGMINPRDSPTSEIPVEFTASNVSATDSILHAQSSSTSASGSEETLREYDGYELDVFVVHGSTLWPCIKRAGGRNLRVESYNSTGKSYYITANYSINGHNENYFLCELTEAVATTRANRRSEK